MCNEKQKMSPGRGIYEYYRDELIWLKTFIKIKRRRFLFSILNLGLKSYLDEGRKINGPIILQLRYVPEERRTKFLICRTKFGVHVS